MPEPVTILIPTYQNVDQLRECVFSILNYATIWPVKIIIINNGQAPLAEMYTTIEHVKVITAEKNLGWEGGLKEGLKYVTTEYVMFANDDIFIPRSSSTWLRDLVRSMNTYKDFGAIGPSSNVVMGPQNIFSPPNSQGFLAQFLVGFCVLFRRKALEEVGGVDDTLPGGDDLDYSIRLRKAGWKLAVQKDVFVYHHGFQTGNKLHGDHTVANGWNSPQMTERTNTAIIKKHGFMAWWETLYPGDGGVTDAHPNDSEGDMVRKFIKGEAVVEMGVGAKKTVPHAIGVDRVAKGEVMPWMDGAVSVADVVADVTEPLPFEDNTFDTLIARHIIEHVVDVVKVLREWTRIVEVGGRVIISTPNENISRGIPLNPEHCHTFTPDSLVNICSLVGLKKIAGAQNYNDIAFTIAFEKQ